ncbi:Cell division control protein 4 [Fulvia fulva]|uniref:Cell division control protein 4 n=1 Tax=Passalora fulva TaxID=5499 RepID=A0A9Q8LI31_PASFU|nr:Cell division control protein 4 [Fulvia fulva]KAK4625526.1 Cell division control protein 4 [Fulvia fulva]UJO17801.1 Cell division control protein 4 [Fulvia fulva]WPV29693.1 Cell division control protein 4 [Fulvia fulva]
MDPMSIGLGLTTQQQPRYSILSTAPASPTEDEVDHHDTRHSETTTTTNTTMMAPKDSTMAQLSFGPATQQTVTTVTTTTTVSLPPLVMKPPRDLYDRDPKQYPLAFTPTPGNIKRFAFDLNGRPTTFHEAEDPEETVRKYHELQAKIWKSKGSIRQEQTLQDGYHTPVRDFSMPQPSNKPQNLRSSHALKRTATPPSIAEAAELASLQRRTKKQRSQLHRSHSELSEQPSLNERAASRSYPAPMNASHQTPITPDTENMGAIPRTVPNRPAGSRSRANVRPSHSRVQELQDDSYDLHMADSESQDEDAQVETAFPAPNNAKKRSFGELTAIERASQHIAATATPPIVEEDLDPVQQAPASHRHNLPGLFTSSQQDASLPSPSLSPITAAANLASRQNAFDLSFADHNEEDGSVVSGLDLDEDSKTQSAKSLDSQSSKRSTNAAPPYSFTHGVPPSNPASASSPTMMDIPTMVDAFDGMPEPMQAYLVYQFLRRCPKTTLQMVANVVNPALKCDPFNVLPPELSLNITRFLDAQSMCRAAQVSKRWRKLINSDEIAWRNLLERDDFVLPNGEIARAVREGWGWQHGVDGFEQDMSKARHSMSPEIADSTLVSDDELTASSSVTTRTMKKKSLVRSSASKKTKRRSAIGSSSITKPTATSNVKWLKLMSTAKGANAFAQAATQAVPHPSNGLDSLRNMHLFKSLYQRHYLIRQAWMDEEKQPQHLAFRAHHRHVVTCLLFDSDKILTGSDDTKINVYDTKTGALRNRLEGHEGGVWALQYDGNMLVSGSTDRSVRIWDIKSGRCLQVFQGHTSTVRCLVILQPVQVDTEADGTPIMMPKEPLIITGSRDSTLRVWKLPKSDDRQIFQAGPPANDRDNPYFLRTLSGHHNSVRAIAAHGDTLVSGSYDCTVRVWKISNGDLVHRLQGHQQKVYSVVLDHARSRCISGSMDNLVKVWDLQTGSCLFNLEGHTSLVGLLDLSHDRLVSAAADSTLRIWDPENGTCKSTLSAHTGAITCFQHDGQKVISGSDRTLKMWNVKNGECVRDLLTDLSGVWQVRFDERRCVAAVQRDSLTYIEVLDFGAARDGVPSDELGRRTVVDCRGREIEDVATSPVDQDPADPAA